ncbi:hypothetical protein [Phaeospirillum tilakii]|uniref:Transposase DDE domain-containing protein n=1 Tax=Phaeospirillum tilakii TaxID=741673 RepID=A0ABW5CB53_9PROT
MKANQSALFDAASAIAATATAIDTAFSRGNGRSRQEDRTVEVFPVGDALADTEWQPFVKTVIRVTRRPLLRSAATGLWNQRSEVAIYLSSATDLPAATWAAAIREHWGIENWNHWVRDVTCGEAATTPAYGPCPQFRPQHPPPKRHQQRRPGHLGRRPQP